ncbi:hypothetical protein ES705_08692 [subsurface metagenome]
MRQAFIIMQIGNPDLDLVCEKAIVPALKSCDFDPKRVDKHTMGRLLKSEIVEFIISSDIIVADLTNERPNCYLEVGYAMGLDKFRNLILTAREDHNQDSPNYKKEGPRIHFDLSGYDILFWEPDNLGEFKAELEKRIRRRIATLPSSSKPWDNEWINEHREKAMAGLGRNNLSGFMEICLTPRDFKLNKELDELLLATEKAQIGTFGWPLGAMDSFGTEYRPKPTTEGIVNELDFKNKESYDYWTLRKDGTFYLLKSLFEDKRKPGHIFFNTRIVRITEALLYSVRLYSELKVPSDEYILIKIRHGGLKERLLTAVGGREITFHKSRKSIDDEVDTEVETILERIEQDLIDLVQKFTTPLFEVFEFFKIDKKVLVHIVNNFVAGKVT